MRGLLKFILLAFAFCINLFSFDFSTIDDWTYTSSVQNSFLPVGVSASQASNVEILSNSYLRIADDIYTYNPIYDSVFNLEFLKDSGYMLENKPKNSVRDLYYYDPSFSKSTVICQKDNSDYLGCSKHGYDDQFGKDPSFKKVEFSYYKKMSISLVSSCQSDEHFNTNTKQCQKCKENESWDSETNTCYKDCNKEGKPNKIALTDGSCIDCSGEKTAMSVLNCFCLASGHGSAKHYSYKKDVDSSASPCSLVGECIDGELVNSFFDPNCKPDNNPDPKPDPKPDENKTKPDDPKPDNPDNPQPNPGGDSGGGNSGGGSGGGNSGGSQDNPNPNPGGSGDNPKPNPNPGGGSGGGGGSGDNVKFKEGDFNADGLNKEMGAFEKAYRGAFSSIEKEFQGSEGFNAFKNGIDQFISNLKGKGLDDISKKDVPKSCSHKETIDFFGHNIEIDFDFCKIVAPASGAFYYLFYVFFFGCFLFLIIKFLIFSF